MEAYRALTDQEHEALEAFAKAHGRKWRETLSMTYWYNARIWSGPVPGMGNTLHAIRNEFGPAWLYDTYKPRKKMPPKTIAERNRDKETRKKAAGLREIRVWVPDRDKFGPEAENRVRKLAAEESAAVIPQKE